MKKCLILSVLLLSVCTFSFSQTDNSWAVTNTSTWINAVNGVRSGGNDKTHTITVTGNVSVPASTEATFGAVTGITVTIEGKGTLSPSANGALLNINAKQTIIVRDLTLRGRSDNPNSVVDNMGGTFRMEGSASLTGNTRAGGVWVDGGTFVMKDRASVSGNSRSNGDNGGGVTVNNGGTFIMQDNASVSGNTISGTSRGNNAPSSYGGGGVAVNKGTFTMEGGTITRNTATASATYNNPANAEGGGVYLVDGTFTMQGGTITGNTVTATVSDSSSYRNSAKARGGGVYVVYNGTFTMQGGTISDNTATATFRDGDSVEGCGGGVYVGGTFTMLDGTISGNTATASAPENWSSRAGSWGGGVANGGTFTMQGGTITGNKTSGNSGGVSSGGTFIMQGGTISGNSSRSGGGVNIYGGTATMQSNASITGNKTTDYGGGVYVDNNGTFTMQGNASVLGNTAGITGGGVCVTGRGTFTMQDNTSISGNTATYYGGGVYNGGTFNKTGGTVYGEDAEANQKNTVVSRVGNALSQYANGGCSWRNVTAGPTMNSDSYGFYLNDGDVVIFPSDFIGTWRRSNFNNTLALDYNIIKSSSSDRIWILQRVSGNAYTFKRADATNTITLNISLTNNSLVISGDSGSGQDNWNGTWYKQR